MSLKLKFFVLQRAHTIKKKWKDISQNVQTWKSYICYETCTRLHKGLFRIKKTKITSLDGLNGQFRWPEFRRLWMDIDLKEEIHKWWISTWKDVPLSSVIRETQIKTMRHHLASTRMTRIKKTGCFGHKAENWNTHTLLVGILNGAAAWKAVCQFLKRLDIEWPYDQAIPLLGMYPWCVHT